MSLAETETVMDTQPNGSVAASESVNGMAPPTSAAAGVHETIGSPEPVYRFYLSPPPATPMQPTMAAAFSTHQMPQHHQPSHHQHNQHQQQHSQQQQNHYQHPQQPMFSSPMGMIAYNPYMPMSPGPLGNGFGQPAFYAPIPATPQQPQQQIFYPGAYGLPAMGMPQISRGATSSVPSSVPSGSGSQAPSEKGDDGRVKTPIVNDAGVPMGGFGVDQDGQYIEIKFPTFGQVQMQQMLQQLHIQQQNQNNALAAAAAAAAAATQAAAAVAMPPVKTPNGVHQPQPQQPATTKQQQQQQQRTSQTVTPVSRASNSVEPSSSKAQDAPSAFSIYDAESFANAHMEDIVFDNKAFFWKIDNWDKLERRATSDVFRCGGHMWRILLRPFGSSHKGVLSLFLECLGTADSSEDWRCTCRFVLAVANPDEPSHNTHGSAYHCFHRNNPNWGFTRFMKLADLRTAPAPGVRPYIEDGACTIAAYLHVIKEPSQ